MAIGDERDQLAALDRGPAVDHADLVARQETIGAALERVIDVLEMLVENQEAVDRQLGDARSLLASAWGGAVRRGLGGTDR